MTATSKLAMVRDELDRLVRLRGAAALDWLDETRYELLCNVEERLLETSAQPDVIILNAEVSAPSGRTIRPVGSHTH